MWNDYYAMAFNPFDKKEAASKAHFESRDFKEMITRLDYLKDTRGIGVFTASPGMGKSYALKRFEKTLNPSLYNMKYLCLSTISVAEFYKQFCEALGVSDRGGKPGMFKSIREQIYYLYKEKRQPLILAVDEAQDLSHSILRDLKMLMNFNYDSLNCFTLILIGEPVLNNTLAKPIHESLKQRITIHYNFKGLGDDEVAEYVTHKIQSAGGARSIISDAALAALHSHCHGNPRIIDNLMTDALNLGAQLDKPCIDPDMILAAVNNQSFA